MIYFCLCWVFAAAPGFLELWGAGFSLQWLLLLRSTVSGCRGFHSCGTRALGAQAQRLWAHLHSCPKVVGSSQTRDETHVPCIGRWTPNHRTKGGSQGLCFSRTLPLLINSWPSIFSVILLGSEFPLWGVKFPGAFM